MSVQVLRLDFCFTYPACDNLGFGNLMPLINRFSAPAAAESQQQAPVWFVFIVI